MRRLVVLVVCAAAAGVPLGSTSSEALGRGELSARARFACYPAQFGSFKPRTLTLADRFGAQLVLAVSFPESICAPAPGSPAGYLACYRTRLISTTVTSAVARGLDEFGRLAARVTSKGLTVCLPAARVDRRPTLRARGLDPYACYRTTATAPLGRSVSVVDDFGTGADTASGRIALCAPAGTIDPGHLLSCSTLESQVRGATVIVRDELGYLKAALGVRNRLCTTVTPTA
jgi:hypothetical protein